MRLNTCILERMKLILDSFWRAAAYCLRPKVMGLSFLPLVLMVVASFGLDYFFWDPAVASISGWLDQYQWVQRFLGWLEGVGLGSIRTVFAPLLLLALVTPVIVLVCLLLVAVFMTPTMVGMVGQRRFPSLERKHGGSLAASVLWSFGSTALAMLALLVSMPFWLIPPLVLILPPLIWGWLTYRVFAFDALAAHASVDERKSLLKKHRNSLLLMGILSGYMGAAPTLLWAWGALTVILAPLLIPLAIWIYTLVFAFASLWFAHFCLAALAELRGSRGIEVLDADGLLDGPRRDLPLLVEAYGPDGDNKSVD